MPKGVEETWQNCWNAMALIKKSMEGRLGLQEEGKKTKIYFFKFPKVKVNIFFSFIN